jgi:hypothetical protein
MTRSNVKQKIGNKMKDNKKKVKKGKAAATSHGQHGLGDMDYRLGDTHYEPDMEVLEKFFEGVKAMGGTVGDYLLDAEGRYGWKVNFLPVIMELDCANVEPIELVLEGDDMHRQFQWLIRIW